MNTHALIPLVATIAYIPLFVILLANRPWDRKQRILFLFLIPATFWSLSDVFFRSDFLMSHKLILFEVGICTIFWMLIQFHYFLRYFYQPQRIKMPFAYIFLISTIALVTLGYIPRGIEITPVSIKIDYGIWIIVIGLSFLFTLGIKDIYSLTRRFRISSDPVERNQIVYLLGAIGVLIAFVLSSTTPQGGQYPVSHIGNFGVACVLTYAVVTHRLVDIRVVFRRMLMWLSLGIVGIAAYLFLFFLAHLAIGFDINVIVLVASTAIAIIAAILIYKLLGVFRAKIEQVFTGDRYNYRRQLAEFITKIHSIPTLEQSGSEFISLLAQSLGCQKAGLLLPESGNGGFIARFAYPPTEDNPATKLKTKLKLKRDSPVVTWLKRENTVLPQRNLSILPEFQSMWQEERESLQSAKVEMFMPLINRDELVAVLTIGGRQDGKNYTVEDADLLESVASRVAASMEKEYFYEQLEEQDRELNLLNRLAAIITSNMSIQEIFEGFAHELQKVVDVDWATIALIEEDQLYFSTLSSTIGSAWQTGERIPLKETATEWISSQKRSLYEPNLTRHSRFWTGAYHIRQGIHSIVYLPLTVKDRCIGTMILASRRANAYNPKQIKLLEQVASQIATPIENAQLYLKAEQRARVDELTGLFNRRHFEERLKEELARHSRHGDVVSILLLDLDNFKTYNDIYGHPSGDHLLNQIGGLIKHSVRGADQAFRYGGDEFIIILPQTTTDDAHHVAERVREEIATKMEAQEIAVTCSIGLASYPSDGVMPIELVTSADTALYYAKRTGGNRIYLSSRVLSDLPAETGTYVRGGSLSAVYALASAVDAKDHYTYGHSRKVSTYAVALAEAINLSPDEVSKVSAAALLHDIGKIGISDKILNKKGKLNDEDWEAIKAHTRLGANIVSNVPNLIPCIGAILYHHERWDGTGYPEGLEGENTPIEARILAIADAFSAMTSTRPYRDALPREKVIEEIRQGAGKHFDPNMIEIFIDLIEDRFPEEATVTQALPVEPPDS